MPSLDDLRRKVESGERLTDAELDSLVSAAKQDASPSLRLSVAHALLNAEAKDQALVMFDRLVREHPRDPRMQLGHARALISLERYTEAEKPVHAALKLQPKDPEALKALAVLSMRRGDIRRARVIIGDVLRIDAFDEEARVIKEELESFELLPQDVRPPDVATRSEFAEALSKALSARGTSFARTPEHFILRLGNGRAARVDVTSLYDDYRAERVDVETAAKRVAGELLERPLELPDTNASLLESVLPVMRPSGFLDRARSASHREGPADLLIYFVLDDENLVRYLPAASLESRRISIDALDTAAWSNLSRRLATPRAVTVEQGEVRLADASVGIWALAEEDGHDAARLLLPEQVSKLRAALGAGPLRVALGQREIALVCHENDALAVSLLESMRSAYDGITGRYRLDENDRLATVPSEQED